jgi:tetratricopeptide (TPR) repeat protein
LITPTPRILVVVGNPFQFNPMLAPYRYKYGQFSVNLSTFILTGTEVDVFLQRQSTFNFSQLIPGQFHLLSLLDVQGRVEFYAWAIKYEHQVTLLVPVALEEVASARLERFLISEDVTIEQSSLQQWTFILGARAWELDHGHRGVIFDTPALLCENPSSELPTLSSEEVETWRRLTGWPDFYARDFKPELINNLRLFDLSLTMNKGCYPGQETVNKIATRRGAAYSPVLIQLPLPIGPGPITTSGKRIGEIESVVFWNNNYYACANLLRDFRVEGLEVNFEFDDKSHKGIVRYYPLLSGDPKLMARELFYEASEDFQKDLLLEAEEKFRQAIQLDPSYADAYEALGVMLGRAEKFNEAITLMDQLKAIDPTSVLAHTNKSLYLMRIGKIEEAEQEKSLATIKSFQKFGEEARLKEEEKKAKEAQAQEWQRREDMFCQVLEIDEDDTLANYGIGSIAVERGQWPRAITHLEKVLLVDTNYSVAYLSLGKAYKGAGLIEKAREVWQSGILVAAKKGDLMPANQMQAELAKL